LTYWPLKNGKRAAARSFRFFHACRFHAGNGVPVNCDVDYHMRLSTH
jgi:hypothetical protein